MVQTKNWTIRNFESGAYSIAGVYPNSSNFAKTKEKYKDNIVYSLQDATSWYYNFNVNRQAYNHTAKTSDEQKQATQAAILNKKFPSSNQLCNWPYSLFGSV